MGVYAVTYDANDTPMLSREARSTHLWELAADAMILWAVDMADITGKSVVDVLHTSILGEEGPMYFHYLCLIKLNGKRDELVITLKDKWKEGNAGDTNT